jgi:hypothetical protein
MANISTKIIELLKNIPGAEMGFLSPQQLQNHPPLLTQTQTQITTAAIGHFHRLNGR